MKKSQDYLTRIDYTTMLRGIGLSTEPLSSYRIKKEMEKHGSESQTPYVYEMIKNLCPRRKNQLSMLCRLDRIPGNVEDESKLVSLINRYFQLRLTSVRENMIFTIENDSITIDDKSKGITVKINRESPSLYKGGTLTIIVENKLIRSFPLNYTKDGVPFLDTETTFRNSKPRLGYLDRYYRPEISFLDIELDDVSKRIIRKKIEQIKAIEVNTRRSHQRRNLERFLTVPDYSLTTKIGSEIMEVENNKERWRYVLNVRGLVLYILGEIHQEKSNKRVHNKRISKVLAHLSVSRRDMPFLYYYEFFRQECKKILPEYYEVELIKKIAEELQYIIYTADIALLQYWITRRYSSEISYYFVAASLNGLLTLTDSLTLSIRDYQMVNLNAMKLYLINHLKEVEGQYSLLKYSTKEEDLQVYF